MTTYIHHRQLPAGHLILVDRNGDTHITFTLGLTAAQQRQAYRDAVGRGDLPKRSSVLFPLLLTWRQIKGRGYRTIRSHPVASVTAASVTAAALLFGAYVFVTVHNPHTGRPRVAAPAAPGAPTRPRRRVPRQKAKRPAEPVPITVVPVVAPAVPGALGVPVRPGSPVTPAPPVAPPSSPPVVVPPTPPVTPPPVVPPPPPRHRAPHVLCVRVGLLVVHLHLCV